MVQACSTLKQLFHARNLPVTRSLGNPTSSACIGFWHQPYHTCAWKKRGGMLDHLPLVKVRRVHIGLIPFACSIFIVLTVPPPLWDDCHLFNNASSIKGGWFVAKLVVHLSSVLIHVTGQKRQHQPQNWRLNNSPSLSLFQLGPV